MAKKIIKNLIKGTGSLRPTINKVGNNIDFDSIYNHTAVRKVKANTTNTTASSEAAVNQTVDQPAGPKQGDAFWDKKNKRQLIYDGPDSVHGNHNFYTREGTVVNSSMDDLSPYKGKARLDYDMLKNYNTELNRFEQLTSPYFNLKYNDPETFYTDLTKNIDKIDEYEKIIGSKYKSFKGNKSYHKTRSYMSDEINKYFGSNVINTDPFNRNRNNTSTNTSSINTTTRQNTTVVNQPKPEPEPDTTVPERSTRRSLTAEEQTAVDKANAQWKADNEARYSEMEKQINDMFKADDEIYGSPEDILNPNYKSKFEPIEETTKKTIETQKKTNANNTKIKNETIEKLNKTKQLYEDILTDWTSASGDFNRQINTRTVGPHNIYSEGKQYLDDIEDLKNNYNVDDYVDGSYTMEQEVFKYSEGKGINGEDVLKVEGDLVDAPNAYASDLNKTLEEAKQTMGPEEYQRYKNNFDVEDALVKTETGRTKLNRKKVVRNKAGLLDDIGKPGAIMTGLNILGAVGDYKDARRKGHGVISSAARAGVQFAVGEALGLWAIPVMAAKEVPGLVMKGAETLYKENRRMNSAANFQAFGDVQFQDTQQLATMRQSGMEMAKMAQYNLQQTLMGNEATYLHR